MGGNSVEGETSHLINIPEEGDGGGQAQKMEEQMRINNPLLPSEPTVTSEDRCIFKLPERFRKMNGKTSYDAPQIVSIGPLHSRKHELQIMTKQLKWQCLEYVLKRNKSNLKRYVDIIRPLLSKATECYSKKINPDDYDFLEIMVVDGCFILECLGFTYFTYKLGIIQSKKEDWDGHPLAPIAMERVKLQQIYRDLLLLENQIPFFVLVKLFEISNMTFDSKDSKDISLLFMISAEVFSSILGIRGYEDYSSRLQEHKCLHLLHMVRSIFIRQPGHDEAMRHNDKELPLAYIPVNIPSISKLRRAGIKVKPRENDNFSKVNFEHGVIEMPKIILNDLMCSFLVNCVAFEQSHRKCSQHFSVYALLLDCLVNTAGDVDYLCDYGVIENYIETDAVTFINNLGKCVTFDWGYFDFFWLCYRVNAYYQNRLHRHWTSFKGEYFNKPWLWISALVAFVLLVLTFLQTYYAMDPKH
ncbi:UPF0481 protein At3g47200-like [Corylus avellana]|uniref:UPF0481 protein At3g47200-like n=1 Tax=Corylus avellana TaxID=13451 RepID=UPI001E1EF4DD|nr:UPF0481 protein At3g47200-like [Corylus avellana]